MFIPFQVRRLQTKAAVSTLTGILAICKPNAETRVSNKNRDENNSLLTSSPRVLPLTIAICLVLATPFPSDLYLFELSCSEFHSPVVKTEPRSGMTDKRFLHFDCHMQAGKQR
jgi:hypothetical protein